MGTEEIRVKLKVFEFCLMPAIQHGLAAWGRIMPREVEEIERMQRKVTASPNININCTRTDEDRDMAC